MAINGCGNTCLIQRLISFNVESLCCNALLTWIDRADEEKSLLALEQFKQLPEPTGVGRALQTFEMLVLIEAAMEFVLPKRAPPGQQSINASKRFDVNDVLLSIATWRAQVEHIAGMEDRVDRLANAERIERALEQLAESYSGPSGWLILQAAVSRHARSRYKADEVVLLLYPMVAAACAAEDRCCAQHRLTAIGMALKIYRLRHGAFPDSLDALAPDLLAEIPLDPFTNEPFLYERRDDGFALWSVGRNGIDDGGSDQTGEFVDGDYAPIDWTGERPMPDGPDDVVVRLPVPELELPGVAP